MNSPEINPTTPENTEILSQAAAERTAELAQSAEASPEHSPEQQAEAIENARHEASKEALLSKERGGAEKKAGNDSTPSAVRKVTKNEKNTEYQKTLKEIRSQLNAPSRAFSKVIHSPAVEKTSDVVGATVARPNAIIAGSTSALVLVSGVYIVAKTYGYPMSGFETIGAFVIGWMIGLTYDYVRVVVSGGKYN